MESKNLQWSDELRKEVREAIATSKLAEIMEKHGIVEKSSFEIQINLVDKSYKPTIKSTTQTSTSISISLGVYVYYDYCPDCSKDGGVSFPPDATGGCYCEF